MDSGNLAGHLLTLRPGLLALLDRPILESRWLDGLGDTLGILEEAAGEAAPAALAQFRNALESGLASLPLTLPAAHRLLDHLTARAADARRSAGWRSRRRGGLVGGRTGQAKPDAAR